MDNESSGTGSLFRIVRRTVFKCVFIDMSTPVTVPFTTVPEIHEYCLKRETEERGRVPFFNSTVTLSLFSFIRNRTSFMIDFVVPGWRRGPRQKAEICVEVKGK